MLFHSIRTYHRDAMLGMTTSMLVEATEMIYAVTNN